LALASWRLHKEVSVATEFWAQLVPFQSLAWSLACVRDFKPGNYSTVLEYIVFIIFRGFRMQQSPGAVPALLEAFLLFIQVNTVVLSRYWLEAFRFHQ
jgi:hypothetical protein